jgi:predicted MPP superfamily phosphohydrolase
LDYKLVLKIAQISDLHINSFRNLLDPMIDAINNEPVDLVVVTGDTVHERSEELFKAAADSLNRLKHNVVVLPGDYDGGPLWVNYFGDRYKALNVNNYCLEFLDTSFMRHKYASGWSDLLKSEDVEQYNWLKGRLSIDKYHIIFSHHPFWVIPKEVGDEYLQDNVRAIYSGHLRTPVKFYFKYDTPRKHFPNGFCCVPMNFHGSSCYMLTLVKDNDEIVNMPKFVKAKQTAW